MNRNLTSKMKRQFFDIIIKRDGGFICFYCKCDLLNIAWAYEHLDNNPMHSTVENIVLACQSCNVKKKNDYDMQILALEKKRQNEVSNFVCVREKDRGGEFLSEIDINTTNFEIAQQYLTEIIQTDGFIEYKEAVPSIAMLCKIKTGHGSTQSVREYINMLTSREGPFLIIKNDEKKRIIVKRTGK